MTTRSLLCAKSLLVVIVLVNTSCANTSQLKYQDEIKAQLEAKSMAWQVMHDLHVSHALTPTQDPATHKYGYKDAQGNIIISPIYDQIENFNDTPIFEGSQMIVVQAGLYGVINTSGKVIIDMIYDDTQRLDLNYIVKKQGFYGVLDKHGKVIIDLTNDELYDLKAIKTPWSKSAYFAKKQGKYGIYDDEGEIILPFEYDKTGKIEQSILPLSKNSKWGMIKFATDQYQSIDFEKPYQVMVDFMLDYDFIHGFTDDLSLVRKDEKYGFIDKMGKLVIGLDYDFALPFYEPTVKIRDIKNPNINNKSLAFIGIKSGDNIHYGAIDKTGKIIIPIQYDDIPPDLFSHLIVVSKGGKFGVVGRTGLSILPLAYDKVQISPICFNLTDVLAQHNKQLRQCHIRTLKDEVKDEVIINY